MKKCITKEQIVETALELLRNKQDFKGVNLREIARTLGCAHTNIYNYFSTYTDLLWATHAAFEEVFMKILRERLISASNAEIRLHYFFDTFLQIYTDNKGWFRLAWLEYIGYNRPESNIIITNKVREEINMYIRDIWQDLSKKCVDDNTLNDAIHQVHCYIIGEVSNFIGGRGLIADEAEFKKNVSCNAVRLLKLCLCEG